MFFHLYLVNITYFPISLTFMLICVFLSLAFEINLVHYFWFWVSLLSWLGLASSVAWCFNYNFYNRISYCDHIAAYSELFLVYLITILMIYEYECSVWYSFGRCRCHHSLTSSFLVLELCRLHESRSSLKFCLC